MEGPYSTWRLVFHVSSGAFDHFNKAVQRQEEKGITTVLRLYCIA